VDRATGLICDQAITLTVFYSKTGYPEALRRIHRPEPEADPEALRRRQTAAHERLVLEELYLLEVGLALREPLDIGRR